MAQNYPFVLEIPENLTEEEIGDYQRRFEEILAGTPPQPIRVAPPPDINRTLLEPINHGFAAALRQALKLGVPTHFVVELTLNQLASVVAQIEPAGVRLQMIEDVVRQFAPLVRQHVDARLTSPGGIIMTGDLR